MFFFVAVILRFFFVKCITGHGITKCNAFVTLNSDYMNRAVLDVVTMFNYY